MENPINPSTPLRTFDLPFNPKDPTILHLDLNSCFASIEQQANPLLRNKPVAVAAYTSPNGCIIAPSVEAKRLGIKVGMRVRDGKSLCRELIIVPPDPNKYRSVHLKLKALLGDYTDKITPKSIDEFVLDFEGSPVFRKMKITDIAFEIKNRIRDEVGDFLRVSVGIAPNRFLAKTGAGLHKPDGLDVIDKDNFMQTYMGLTLTDLCGIKMNNAVRLNNMGIFTVADFFAADAPLLKAAFGGITGYYWYLRLRGFETDDVVFARRSYGNSYALPKAFSTAEELAPLLQKLVVKMGMRMRKAGYRARGVHVGLLYRDWSWWHHGQVQPETVFDSRDIYKIAMRILGSCPYKKPVHTLSVSCFDLVKCGSLQTVLLDDLVKKENLVTAIDKINERWGNFVITPALMMGTAENVPDRVAFGGIKELEEIVLDNRS
jgi:DNA polymerase-4